MLKLAIMALVMCGTMQANANAFFFNEGIAVEESKTTPSVEQIAACSRCPKCKDKK